jgi:protein O-GlcNAc transferase
MYPASMGADWIDYFITDSFVTPSGHERFFTEKLVYLPAPYLPTNCDQPISDDCPSRAECGLPEEGFVYCSFNNADKIKPDLFDVWMRILRRVPGSVLWQRSDSPTVQKNLREEASKRGIDAERLVFAGQLSNTAEHLARHCQADLFLDTLTHGGHGTAVDALWAGVPVLACPREVFTSRVAGSLLTVAGLTELIVEDLNEYERRAIELAQRHDLLQNLRCQLAEVRARNRLFDTTRLARSLETAFEEMWQRHQLGQSPAAIVVEDMQRPSDS